MEDQTHTDEATDFDGEVPAVEDLEEGDIVEVTFHRHYRTTATVTYIPDDSGILVEVDDDADALTYEVDALSDCASELGFNFVNVDDVPTNTTTYILGDDFDRYDLEVIERNR